MFDSGLRITGGIRSLTVARTQVTITTKLQEEFSYSMINTLRKYLAFFRIKNEMRTKLLREFTNNPYPFTRNVYKYLLMFFSTAMFLVYQL